MSSAFFCTKSHLRYNTDAQLYSHMSGFMSHHKCRWKTIFMVESAASDRMAHPSDGSIACEKHQVFQKMNKYRKINGVGSFRTSICPLLWYKFSWNSPLKTSAPKHWTTCSFIYETDETSVLNKLKLPGSSRKFWSPLGLPYNCLF